MSRRCIVLGDGKRVTLTSYVRAWKLALSLPSKTWVGRLPSGWPGAAGEAVREFRQGLHARINRHLPWFGKGRKWSDEWQWDTRRAANDLNTPRLIIRWLPAHLRARFPHRISE